MKTLAIALAVLGFSALTIPVQAGILQTAGNTINATFENLSFVTEFGVGVPLNDDLFQQDYKEAIYGGQRVELYVGRGLSLYAKYSSQTYDVVAGADSTTPPIDVSGWAYGAMVQGELNATGTVVGYLELGLQKSISPTEPDEWQFWQGLAARSYLTPSKKTFIDLGLRYKPLGDTPKIQELLPRIAFGVCPGKL